MDEIQIPACDPKGYFLMRTSSAKKPSILSQEEKTVRQGMPCDAASFQVTPALLPDPDALFSLLQFGAVIPPLSPWSGIVRLLPGYRYEGESRGQPIAFSPSMEVKASTQDLTATFTERFDAILLRAMDGSARPVVLFSGGVDSGLIAARLAHLGYRDTLLLNYSFGPDDRESALAVNMARTLGLEIECFSCQRLGCESLEFTGKTYPFPFGDSSVVPTYALVKRTVERLCGMPCVIFDGTGADGGFGMTAKINRWRQFTKIPKWILDAAVWTYERTGVWYRVNALENRLKLLRRLHDMPLLSAILAQNPLAGILYAADGRQRVDAFLDEWVSGWAGDSLLRKTIAADLAMTCANTFAQKAYPIFRKAGLRVVYPFMENELVDFALAVAPSQDLPEKKALLKDLLARQVPPEMVYRPKSGFVDTSSQTFYDPVFREMLWAATEEKSVLSGLLFKTPLRNVCDRLRRCEKMPYQLLNCIWAITFTDRWYRTV